MASRSSAVSRKLRVSKAPLASLAWGHIVPAIARETYNRSELSKRRDKRITVLRGDLERDRRRYRRMLDQYEELRDDLEELNDAIQRRQRLLDALRETAPGLSPRPRGDKSMTKPQVAERVLFGSLEPLFPRQVRDEAVQRGWLPRDGSSHNQLSVAMSKMARKGRLVRGADGRYSLPKPGSTSG